MNAFLLSIGITLALILSAAFAVPMFVDWDAYRGAIEEQAAQIVGRPVSVEGHVEVRLVPFPVLRASDVRIGGEGSEEGVAALSARGGLMPLLSGEVHISELTLERPELHFSVSPDGFVAWGVESEPATIPVAPEQVRVDDFEIRGGRIVIDDARTNTQLVAENLDLAGTASSLAGPFKFDGAAVLGGQRYDLRVALGRVQPGGTIRLGASVRPDGRQVVVTLDGNLGYEEGRPRYSGSVTIENVVAAAETEAGGGDADGTDTGTASQRWRFDASTTATPESVVFEQLGLRVGEAEHPISLSGAAQIELGADPRFQAVLSSRQIDVDRALGGGPDDPVPPHAAVAALAELVAPDLVPMDGRLSVDIGSLVIGGSIVEALGAELLFEEGSWRIGRAQAVLPGDTDVALSGRVVPGGGEPSFRGAVTVASEHASPLATWLFGQEAHLPGLGAVTGSLKASAGIELEQARFALDRLEVTTDRNTLSGSIVYAAPSEEERRLAIVLRTDELNVRGLPLDRLVDALRGKLPGEGDAGIDLALDLDAGKLVGPVISASNVEARGLLSGEELRIDRLEIGDFGGFSVAAEGYLDDLGGDPTGEIELRLSSNDLAETAETANVLDYGGLASFIEPRSEMLSPATATIRISSAVEEGASGLNGRLEGEFGGTEIAGEARLEGRLNELATARVRLDLDARNEDASALFSQLGLLSLASEGAGSLALEAAGSVRDGVEFELAGEGLPASGMVAGTVAWPDGGPRMLDANLSLEIRDVALFLGQLGLSPLVEPNDAGTVEAHLAARGQRYEITDLRYDGVTQLQGSLAIDAGEAQHVSGVLQADAIALDRMITGVAGVEELLLSAGEGDADWSADPFSLMEIAPWSLALELSAPEASWEQLAASDVSFRLVSDGEGFAFRNFTGRMWDGRVEGDVELETLRGSLHATSRLRWTDAALAQVVWQDDGRPIATGRLDLALDLNGAGRTPSALVSSVSGEGSFTLRDGTIRHLDPAAFERVVTAVDEGMAVEEEPIASLFRDQLGQGALAYRSVQGAVAANEGTMRVGRVKLDTGDLTVFASGSINLPDLSLESEWTLRADETGEGRSQEASLRFEGPMADPSRSISVAPLVSHLTVRQFEREVERLEDLQSEILERERLGRELMQLGRERRERAEDAASEEVEEAAPTTPADIPTGREAPTDPGAQSSSSAPSDDGAISLDREQFRRTIQDLLRGVDDPDDRSSAPEAAPANLADIPMRRALPAAARGRPLNIDPEAQ